MILNSLLSIILECGGRLISLSPLPLVSPPRSLVYHSPTDSPVCLSPHAELQAPSGPSLHDGRNSCSYYTQKASPTTPLYLYLVSQCYQSETNVQRELDFTSWPWSHQMETRDITLPGAMTVQMDSRNAVACHRHGRSRTQVMLFLLQQQLRRAGYRTLLEPLSLPDINRRMAVHNHSLRLLRTKPSTLHGLRLFNMALGLHMAAG